MTLSRLFRRVIMPGSARKDRRGLILLYHRITALPCDPWNLAVSPQNFAEQLEVMAKQTSVTSLDGMVNGSTGTHDQRPNIAITFDDGYLDNLTNGLPLLAQSGMPATVFITTSVTTSRASFWWDELQNLLLQPGEMPETLSVRYGESRKQWSFSTNAVYTETDFEQHRSWKAHEQPPPTERQNVFLKVYEFMKGVDTADRHNVLRQVRSQGKQLPPALPCEVLSEQEIVKLAKNPQIEIGGHTDSHPFLSRLSVARQQREIEGNKRYLENLAGKPLTAFAYPHGDFDSDTVRMVRDAGYESACTTAAGVLPPKPDLHRLPRLVVGNWNGEEFSRRLNQCWEANA